MKTCQGCKARISRYARFCPVCCAPFEGVLYGESLKSRNTAVLLCFFLGILGAHRFYLNRHFTGFLMLMTLGGLGVWAALDFFWLFFGSPRDSQNFEISPRRSLALWILIPVVPALLALGHELPGRLRECSIRQESRAAHAAMDTILAQARFKQKTGFYAGRIEELELKGLLARDPEASYGGMSPYDGLDGRSCLVFSMAFKNVKSGFAYDSCAEPKAFRLPPALPP
jgi:hypothetical protein